MKNSTIRIAWASAGLLATLLAGAPAYADDVELLLSIPGASSAAKPNVLFILDSSGSMKSIESSQEPYDKSKTYTGDCSSSYYYWTKNANEPICDSDDGTVRRVEKAHFVCAAGIPQIADGGYWTDNMSQYRKRKGTWKWRNLSKGATAKDIECATDNGIHGSGTSGEVFAQIGSNIAKFTSDSGAVVDWGSPPTEQIVTMYDPNYLNWFYSPPATSMSRTEIVKTVTRNVLDSMNNVNVGFMQFNFNQGGPVTHAIKDLDTNRAAANAVVAGLPANTWTPLSETMFEAARYWNGQKRYYGGVSATDAEALVDDDPATYKQATEYACAKNFTVLLTDGEPTEDVDATSRMGLLSNFDDTMGTTTCTGSGHGACLDDISEYLSKTDINADVDGTQSVTTYTIGFKVNLPILKATAENSGGKYYQAEDVQSLTKALTDIVTNIFDRDISFTAPAIAVNAFNRTQHLNDLYVSVFRATDRHHWPGNLKKYTIDDAAIVDQKEALAIDPDTGFFADTASNFWNGAGTSDGPDVSTGGAANIIPDPVSRKVYTNNGVSDLTDASNSISTANIANFSGEDFGLSGSPGEPDLSTIIEWTRGVDVKDEDNDATTFTRQVMGDTLHSQPAAIVYGNDVNGDPEIVVFSATNDGYLHAVDAKTGKELWSFIPKELMPDLADLYINENVNFKHYGIDGDLVPVVADRNKNGVIDIGTDFVYLFFGMRRGGDNYYALDITNRNAPKLKWIQSYPEFGQSWSTPVAARVNVNSGNQTSTDDAVLILGSGYDTVHDQASHPSSTDVEGAGIVMLDIETGAQIWRAGIDSNADLTHPAMKRAIPTKIRVLDITGDGYADRMYAADLGGQIWRFDMFDGKTPNNLVTGGVIAQFGAEGLTSPSAGETRRFYTTPDVSLVSDSYSQSRYLAISLGTGYRAHPLDNSANDRFYSLRDKRVFESMTQSEYNGYTIAKDSDMTEVSGNLHTAVSSSAKGWRLTLPAGQKVLSDSATFNGSVFFVTFEPQFASADPCQAGLSVNRLYRVDAANGDPVNPSETVDETDAVAVDEERVTELAQGGIAPRPSFLFPSPTDPNCKGEECAPAPIGCVGVECFDPGYANSPVRTLWTEDGVY